jgi:acyl carrier protein
MSSMNNDIRDVLQTHAHLRVDAATISPDADLFAAGMTSHASISVMLALEERFDIEFPDNMLKRGTFESIASIENAVSDIKEQIAS